MEWLILDFQHIREYLVCRQTAQCDNQDSSVEAKQSIEYDQLIIPASERKQKLKKK